MINYTAQIPVQNVPEDHEPYIVAKILENTLQYWGSHKDPAEAERTAREIDGIVLGEGEEDG